MKPAREPQPAAVVELHPGPVEVAGPPPVMPRWIDATIAVSLVLMVMLCTMEDGSRVGRLITSTLPVVLVAFSCWKGWIDASHMRRFLAPLAGVFGAILLSSAMSIDREFSFENLVNQHLGFFALFLAIGAWASTAARQRVFLWALLAGALFSAVLGIVLYHYAPQAFEAGWIKKTSDYIHSTGDAEGVPYYRAKGLLQSYTRSAMVFFAFLPAICALLLLHWRVSSRALLALCVLTAIVSVWYLVLTKARGAWLTIAVVSYLTLLMMRCSWRVLVGILLTMAVVVGIVLAATPSGRARAMTMVEHLNQPDLLLSGRIDLWGQGRVPISENLWTGVGYGGNIFLTDAAEERGYDLVNHVRQPDLHNLYMQTLAEVGVIGIVMYAWLMGTLLHVGIMLLWRRKPAAELAGTAVGLATMAAVMLSGIVYYMNEEHVAQIMWCTFALIAGGAVMLDTDQDQEEKSRGSTLMKRRSRTD